MKAHLLGVFYTTSMVSRIKRHEPYIIGYPLHTATHAKFG